MMNEISFVPPILEIVRVNHFWLQTIMKEKQKTLQNKGPLVAVDAGSASIRVMAAEQNSDSTLHILGVETLSKARAIEKGIITNSTEVGGAIRHLLTLLRNRIGMPSDTTLSSAFVTLGGYKMQATKVVVKRDLLSRNAVPQSLLDTMLGECKSKIANHYPELVVISAEPIRYILDSGEQNEAPTIEQRTRYITIEYDVFVCQKEAVDKMIGSFERANVGIESSMARPQALLTALCNDDDMADGVAILDFGHQTTTLSIYKGEQFRMTQVVPLGGYHITRDIQDTQISFANAEAVKHRFGCALESSITQTQTLNIRSDKTPEGKVQLSTSLLARIIQARLEEIVKPLLRKVRDFQAGETLSKIYVTGGGAMLREILPFIQQYTTIPVEYGSHADWLEIEVEDEFYQPQYAALIGTLVEGATYREEHQHEALPKVKFWDRLKDKFTDTTLDLFTENN